MLTRDQGQRRIGTVTIGLAAASLAGTLAVAGAAWAKESSKNPQGATGGDTTDSVTPGTSGGAATPAPNATAAPPAATEPAPNVQNNIKPTKPAGGEPHVTSGGS